MNTKLTRILLIEDNPGDARLVREMLKEAGVGQHDFDCADRLSTGLEHLAEQRPDIVLLDLGLPDSQGLNTLARVRATAGGIPVVVLTGLDDESVGMEAVRQGAQDYLVKGQIIGKSTALRRVVDYAIERKRIEEELRRAEENFRHSLDDSPLGIRIVNNDGETVYANRAILDIYGYDSIEELKATPRKERYTPESYAEHQVRKEKRQRGEYVPSNYEISIVRKGGEIRHLESFRKEVLWNGKTQFQVLYKDITERKLAEKALAEKSRQLENRVTELEAVNHFNVKLVNERVEFIARLEHRLEQFSRLHQIARGICSTASLDECLNSVVSHLSQVVNSDFTSIILVGEDGNLSRIAQTREMNIPPDKMARPGSLIHAVITSGQPIYVPNYAFEPRNNPLIQALGVKSWAGIPLVIEGKIRGVLVARSLKEDAFAEDMEVLAAFADWAGQAIHYLESAKPNS